jgi:hypothetical protein
MTGPSGYPPVPLRPATPGRDKTFEYISGTVDEMPLSDEQVQAQIEARQRLPMGKCTHCEAPTGRVAPYYARLEIPRAGIVMRLPFCEDCISIYSGMVEDERPAPIQKMRKTA